MNPQRKTVGVPAHIPSWGLEASWSAPGDNENGSQVKATGHFLFWGTGAPPVGQHTPRGWRGPGQSSDGGVGEDTWGWYRVGSTRGERAAAGTKGGAGRYLRNGSWVGGTGAGTPVGNVWVHLMSVPHSNLGAAAPRRPGWASTRCPPCPIWRAHRGLQERVSPRASLGFLQARRCLGNGAQAVRAPASRALAWSTSGLGKSCWRPPGPLSPSLLPQGPPVRIWPQGPTSPSPARLLPTARPSRPRPFWPPAGSLQRRREWGLEEEGGWG